MSTPSKIFYFGFNLRNTKLKLKEFGYKACIVLVLHFNDFKMVLILKRYRFPSLKKTKFWYHFSVILLSVKDLLTFLYISQKDHRFRRGRVRFFVFFKFFKTTCANWWFSKKILLLYKCKKNWVNDTLKGQKSKQAQPIGGCPWVNFSIFIFITRHSKI